MTQNIEFKFPNTAGFRSAAIRYLETFDETDFNEDKIDEQTKEADQAAEVADLVNTTAEKKTDDRFSGLDEDDLPWDERIHSKADEPKYKSGANKGKWKARKGVDPDYKKRIEAELRGESEQVIPENTEVTPPVDNSAMSEKAMGMVEFNMEVSKHIAAKVYDFSFADVCAKSLAAHHNIAINSYRELLEQPSLYKPFLEMVRPHLTQAGYEA